MLVRRCINRNFSNESICFLFVQLYRIRAGASRPQGLLLATMFIMFSLLALNLEIMGLAPQVRSHPDRYFLCALTFPPPLSPQIPLQYISYGSQTYTDANGNSAKCNLAASVSNCTMTQIGTPCFFVVMRVQWYSYLLHRYHCEPYLDEAELLWRVLLLCYLGLHRLLLSWYASIFFFLWDSF